MSVISAILTKDFIVVSTDSILTSGAIGEKVIDYDSYSKRKFICFPELKCVASYWGLAYLKDKNTGKIPWRTYEWIFSKVSQQNNFKSIEELGLSLKEDLVKLFDQYKLPKMPEFGIGIHLTGFEKFEKQSIPELFLLTNYNTNEYNDIGKLSLSRRTYGDYTNDWGYEKKSLVAQRKLYFEKLSSGEISIYNNGNPSLFNIFASALQDDLQNALQYAKRTGKLNIALSYKNFIKKLASEPINSVAKFQKEYYSKGNVVVGGKIHTVIMTPDGRIEQ